MANFWAIVKAIPEVLKAIRAFFSALAFWNYQAKKKQNEAIKKQVEDAKTTEEKQKALDAAASKLGSN